MWQLHSKSSVFAVAITIIIALVGCNTVQPPTPTVAPTATPATAQERVELYDKHLRWHMSRLLQYVEEIEANSHNALNAFSVGLKANISYLGIERLALPSKTDFEELESEYDPGLMHEFLLQALIPCKLLGVKAMLYMEGEPLSSLLESNTQCKAELLFLKQEFPRMFDCPRDLGVCSE